MRGWFVPGFWPITRIRSASAKSARLDRALADADHLGEAGAARLVAHVRAVGEVVGAEAPHEELPEEGGLVAGAARGVEDRAVRRGERRERVARRARTPRPTRSARSGRRPRRRSIGSASRPCASSQRPRLGEELRERRRAKNARSRARVGRLVSHGLRAVLAELEDAALGGLGPRAARAVEAFALVHERERGRSARPARRARRGARSTTAPSPPAAGVRRASPASYPLMRSVRSRDALARAVHVEAAPAQEAYQRDAARGRERDGERGRRRDRGDERDARGERLLHDLERDPPRDEEAVARERQAARVARPSRSSCRRRCGGRRPRARRGACRPRRRAPPRAGRPSRRTRAAPRAGARAARAGDRRRSAPESSSGGAAASARSRLAFPQTPQLEPT